MKPASLLKEQGARLRKFMALPCSQLLKGTMQEHVIPQLFVKVHTRSEGYTMLLRSSKNVNTPVSDPPNAQFL